jgi:YHS domain-containing protein
LRRPVARRYNAVMANPEAPPRLLDPVCGRELIPDPRRLGVSFRGRRWFFCDDPERGCRLAFKREPERWADARPEAGVRLTPTVPPPERPPSPFRVVSGAVSGGERSEE